MANINATIVKRFRAGGTITIGANTVLKVVAGTMKFTPGLREPMETKFAGLLDDVLSGDEQHTELEFDIAYTSHVDTGEVYALLQAAPTNGKVTTYSIVVKIFDFEGDTHYETFTFALCYAASRGLTHESAGPGQPHDTLKIKLIDNEAKPAVAAA